MDSLSHCFIEVIDSLILCFSHWFFCLIDWLIVWSVAWLIVWFMNSLVHWFVHSFFVPIVCLYLSVHSIIQPFNHLIFYSFILSFFLPFLVFIDLLYFLLSDIIRLFLLFISFYINIFFFEYLFSIYFFVSFFPICQVRVSRFFTKHRARYTQAQVQVRPRMLDKVSNRAAR